MREAGCSRGPIPRPPGSLPDRVRRGRCGASSRRCEDRSPQGSLSLSCPTAGAPLRPRRTGYHARAAGRREDPEPGRRGTSVRSATARGRQLQRLGRREPVVQREPPGPAPTAKRRRSAEPRPPLGNGDHGQRPRSKRRRLPLDGRGAHRCWAARARLEESNELIDGERPDSRISARKVPLATGR